MQPAFLVFDTELGGTTSECSLLTAYFAVCDKEWNILNELDLKLRPNNGEYTIQTEAMAINKIDLNSHDRDAISYSEGGKKLREFLWACTFSNSIKLIPVGKGIKGDIDKVTSCLLNKNNFHQFVSYRYYEIGSILIFLKRVGKLESSLQESLSSIGDYLNIKSEWHTAKGDTIASIEIIKRLETL